MTVEFLGGREVNSSLETDHDVNHSLLAPGHPRYDSLSRKQKTAQLQLLQVEAGSCCCVTREIFKCPRCVMAVAVTGIVSR